MIEPWDEAVSGRDRERMIALLMSVELTVEQAAFTADTTLVNVRVDVGQPGVTIS